MPKPSKNCPITQENVDPKNPSILLVGATGSGEDALCKCISLLGYKTWPQPKKIIHLQRLNDQLLNLMDMGWTSAAPVTSDHKKLLLADDVEAMVLKAFDTPTFKKNMSSPIALADSRISLLLAPWAKVTSNINGTASAVILCLRHPLAVAKQLEQEEGLRKSQALNLWLRYTLEAEKSSRGMNRCIVLWDTLIADPKKTLKSTAKSLNLVWPHEIVKVEKRIIHAIRAHTIDTPKPLEFTDPLSKQAEDVFALLSKGPVNGATQKSLDGIRRAFDKQSRWLRPILVDMDGLRDETARLNKDLKNLLEDTSSNSAQGGTFKSVHTEMQRDAALLELAHLEETLNTLKLSPQKPAPSSHAAEKLSPSKNINMMAELNIARAELATQKVSAVNTGQRYRPLTESERRKLEDAIDADYYHEQAARNGMVVMGDPFFHYLREGARLGLSPHPLFVPDYYLSQTAASITVDLPPYADFVLTRRAQGIKPHPLFDPDYYFRTNPKLASSGVLPHIHYDKIGWKENCAPNAWLRPKWYTSQNEDVLKGGNPLIHYFNLGELQGYQPHPSFAPNWYRETYLEGDVSISPLQHYLDIGISAGNLTQPSPFDILSLNDDTRLTLLCVAHSASGRIYGSERSFLDVLSSIDRSKYRIVVMLPIPDPAYVKRVNEHADLVQFTKRRWWSDMEGISDEIVQDFESVIETHKIDAVYANTIILREPLIAARNKNIPAICHIREAITHDVHLCETIGLTAYEIIEQVRERSDYFIANSQIIADMYGGGNKTHLVYNAVEFSGIQGCARWPGKGPLVLGTLSSNLPKKGIGDVVKLAEASQKEGLDVRFKIFGPLSEEAKRLQKYCKRRKIKIVEFPGYADDAGQAIHQIDVVLNFSHFAESFGRTIAEAGAAARPAIVYKHGALPEVVDDGVSGVVIPYLEPLRALPAIKRFIEDPEVYFEMGRAARQRAEDLFSRSVLKQKINGAFDRIMDETESTRPDRKVANTSLSRSDLHGVTAAVTVIIPNYNYEDYLPERIRSILEQTRPPTEIIFLDDASSDNSVAVAEAILAEGNIPYKILASGENLGVYKQWLRGNAEATQPWVWIAEADDSAEPNFLEELLKREDQGINIIYAQSRKIDDNGNIIAIDNKAHTNAINPTRWSRDFVSTGIREVSDSLAFRNSIPNASAALLRRSAITGIEDKLLEMKYAGDWLLYAHMLRSGGLAFVSSPLNHFRRHQRSVTITHGKDTEYLKELSHIRLYMAEKFPLRLEHFDRMNAFLDRDYKIDGVAKNSEAKEIAPMQAKLRETLAGRKRIGIITTNNGSHYGGSEMLWRETAHKLREDGHDVIVLIKRWEPRPEFFHEMETAGITLLFKEEDGFIKLRSLRPDITLVSIGDQDEGTEYYPDLKRSQIPYVIVNQLTKEARFWPIRQAKTKAVTEGYVGAEQAFFTSWNNHRVMQDRLGTPLPNGALHFNPYHIDRSKVPAWPETDVINIAIPSKLLFIHKGQDILTEFLGKRKWQSENVIFNFYGVGPDEDNLLALAQKNKIENFVLHGRVSDISEIWTINQALLMPSRMEGLPIMLVSAMLSGRVPIVTDIGGHAEVVTNNISGFIAANPTASDVEDALTRALARQNEWQEIGQKSREEILDFLPENPVDDFVKKLMALTAGQDQN